MKYCVSCHGEKGIAAQFDLRPYTTMASVVKDHAHWALVLEQARGRARCRRAAAAQPTPAERQAVIAWIDAMRKAEARRNAGDPGLVLARRLSNAEYNYTIRDLTGSDLRPAREFPVDPANQAGFDNSGESLAMSPALLTKYLQAAREVADHLVLQAARLAFAPHPMLVETDRDKYCVNQIIDFYKRQNTDYSDYFRGRVALQAPRRARQPEGDARVDRRREQAQPEVPRDGLADARRDQGRRSVRSRSCRRCGASCPLRAAERACRERATASRCATRCATTSCSCARRSSSRYTPIRVKGLGETAQPFLMWRNRQYATNRTNFNRAALQVEGEQLPATSSRSCRPTRPQDSSTHDNQSRIAAQAAAADPDLQVPAGQRARIRGGVRALRAVFPDAFYMSERGRYFPDQTRDTGRHLSAGFHNVMGYFRDDQPLYELILDETGQKQLDALWQRARLHRARPDAARSSSSS